MVLELCSVVGQLDVALHAAEKSGWNMRSIGAAAAVFHCAPNRYHGADDPSI
jgi:hypothetical protein